ncbi:MAG TPA: hypothetical protein V6C81_28675 [Planktothrix sp.]|jgi:hypothetical protein
MFDHPQTLPMVFVVGSTLLGLLIDRIMHKSDRTGFVIGTSITTIAVCGMAALILSHPDFSEKGTRLLALGLFLMALVGGTFIDNNNIQDQEAGSMSKYGSWWDGWNDNYFTNIWDKSVSSILMVVVGILMVFVALMPDTAASVKAQTVAPVKEAVVTKLVTAATANGARHLLAHHHYHSHIGR